MSKLTKPQIEKIKLQNWMSAVELKPCPHCGSKAIIDYWSERTGKGFLAKKFYVHCSKSCNGNTILKESAVNNWNQRI